ncbi:hypothetical protein [Absidia glauca]|uniref:Membrane anchor Opy2 N-terminal domain-containing protein n=1 Tax=Absidia glauca TaxID=4829 RepID=A0A163MQ93_ABSGL|nr:hypothetical protein [Absidia glauca]
MVASSFYLVSFIVVLLLLSECILGQHTTSPRFSPIPQPTSSGVYCIQMVCPSESIEASCPADCHSGCKTVPDQCCPQNTVAVCQDGGNGSSTPATTLTGSSYATGTPTTTTTTTATTTTTTAQSSGATTSPSPSVTGPVNSNSGVNVRPSFYYSIGLVIIIGSLYI